MLNLSQPVTSSDFCAARPGDTGTADERPAARETLRLRDANGERLADLLKAERASLEAAARRVLSCRSSAEDAVQEAAARALSTLQPFYPERARDGRVGDVKKAYRAWFYQVLTNVCLDMARAAGRQIRGVPFASLPEVVIEAASIDPEPGPEEVFNRVMALLTYPDANGRPVELSDAREAFEALEDGDRLVVQKMVLESVSVVDLSEHLQVTPGATRSKKFYALQRLADGVRWCQTQRALAEAAE